jgi:hypothetical protein
VATALGLDDFFTFDDYISSILARKQTHTHTHTHIVTHTHTHTVSHTHTKIEGSHFIPGVVVIILFPIYYYLRGIVAGHG